MFSILILTLKVVVSIEFWELGGTITLSSLLNRFSQIRVGEDNGLGRRTEMDEGWSRMKTDELLAVLWCVFGGEMRDLMLMRKRGAMMMIKFFSSVLNTFEVLEYKLHNSREICMCLNCVHKFLLHSIHSQTTGGDWTPLPLLDLHSTTGGFALQ